MIITDFNKMALRELVSAWEIFGCTYEIENGEIKNIILKNNTGGENGKD